MRMQTMAGATMRRAAVMVVERIDPELRLQTLYAMLTDWAQWQGAYRMKLGCPTRSSGFFSGGSDGCRSDDLYESSESSVFASIDAAVDDLLPAQRAAIMRRYGLAAVFRFPRANYAEQLEQAHQVLMSTLPKKGVDIV